ncbi:MAG TPA: thiamine-phosphate kinase [Bacteroidales bacterium]|jgi:thiamine-monophosphate kinase|nr:thiamine-phosphate kinase [Bacteroidales bacterium]HBZ20153.1 thiamine-phosphate kinase [Bacteroidales bacterium]
MNESENNRTPIGSFGKFGLITHLTEKTVLRNSTTVSGIGDDSAIIDSGEGLTLVSTDLLLEGIHFNLVYTPLKHLGYKAVIRAISDIYAMNGTPGQVLIGLGISSRFSVEQIDDLYEGINLACTKYKVDLAGGDITSSLTGLTIGATGIGKAEKGSIVRRNSAKPNDLICVTGNFGASFMGLQVLERERKLFDKDKAFKPDLSGYEYIIERQLKPELPEDLFARLKDANILPSSMIDVSDGLASDLLHVCRLSGTGCRIYSSKIPIDSETCKASEEFNLDPLIPALNGGEDYEFLFTVPLENAEKIRSIPDVTLIGHMTTIDLGNYLVSEEETEIELKAQGWEKA